MSDINNFKQEVFKHLRNKEDQLSGLCCRAHTAVKISPRYPHPVIHVLDASKSVVVVSIHCPLGNSVVVVSIHCLLDNSVVVISIHCLLDNSVVVVSIHCLLDNSVVVVSIHCLLGNSVVMVSIHCP